jgi:predicted RNA-binding Zn-ribbon protein involved in translation (DUF1610 family)
VDVSPVECTCTACDFDPRPLLGSAIGMFHCPACGEMVVGGFAHGYPDDAWECPVHGPILYALSSFDTSTATTPSYELWSGSF